MDTRQLAAFCAVVERKSFSQAAERLGVTQPAVSLQIRSLEQRLGRQLLDRSGRRVEPTEAGRRALRVCAAAPRARGASPGRAPGRRRGRGHRDARARGLDRPRRHGRAPPALRVLRAAPGRARAPDRVRHPDARRPGGEPGARARHRRSCTPPPRCDLRAVLPGRGRAGLSGRPPASPARRSRSTI